MQKILVLQGPNLNMLGVREKSFYGDMNLETLHTNLQQRAGQLNLELTCMQSNREYELIERVHASFGDGTDFIIINPAGFTHTSVALRDALLSVNKPFIELHISNVYAREDFRKNSYFSDKAVGVISGLGTYGYTLALQAAKEYLEKSTQS